MGPRSLSNGISTNRILPQTKGAKAAHTIVSLMKSIDDTDVITWA